MPESFVKAKLLTTMWTIVVQHLIVNYPIIALDYSRDIF